MLVAFSLIFIRIRIRISVCRIRLLKITKFVCEIIMDTNSFVPFSFSFTITCFLSLSPPLCISFILYASAFFSTLSTPHPHFVYDLGFWIFELNSVYGIQWFLRFSRFEWFLLKIPFVYDVLGPNSFDPQNTGITVCVAQELHVYRKIFRRYVVKWKKRNDHSNWKLYVLIMRCPKQSFNDIILHGINHIHPLSLSLSLCAAHSFHFSWFPFLFLVLW